MKGNPFDVLGVEATAPALEIERAGQRLLAMIAVGAAEDSSEAREHEVRWALEELRDPVRRLAHEVRSRALTARNVNPIEVEPLASAIEAALPSSEPTPAGKAEELLLGAVEEPAPYRLPSDHAEERRLAFEPLKPEGPAVLEADEVDWQSVFAFRPESSESAPKSSREGTPEKKGG